MFKKLTTSVKIILVIQACCLLVGTYTHADWVLKHGFLYPDPRFTIYTRVFWDSLTFLDPLAALLLFASPKKGVWLTVSIIVIDVIHNAFISNSLHSFDHANLMEWLIRNEFFILQCLFCIFVLSTLKTNLRGVSAKKIGYYAYHLSLRSPGRE